MSALEIGLAESRTTILQVIDRIRRSQVKPDHSDIFER